MTIQSHLVELQRKHATLEKELKDAKIHPSVDDARIAEMKRRKLQLKDEIAKLASAQRTMH